MNNEQPLVPGITTNTKEEKKHADADLETLNVNADKAGILLPTDLLYTRSSTPNNDSGDVLMPTSF